MTNYAETSSTTDLLVWRAAKLIQCFNDFGGTPSMAFHEVERTAAGDALVGEVYTGRRLEISGTDPTLKIPYIDPETYEQVLTDTGKPIEGQYWTAEQIMYALACAYIYAAKIKDRDDPAPPVTIEPDAPPIEE